MFPLPYFLRSPALALLLACVACGSSSSDPIDPTGDARPREVTPPVVTTPPPVTASGGLSGLVAGGRRSCVLRDGELRCWGDANRGSLGAAVTMSTTSVPTAIAGLEGAIAVALGESHACARMKDDSARCWGADEYGALGNGGTTGDTPTPQPVVGLAEVSAVAAGGHHSCAIAGGRVHCWGGDDGKSPRAVAVPGGATTIAVGEQHACAVTPDRKVFCWGDNDKGQLGTTGDPGGVVEVTDLGVVEELAAAGDYSCARSAGKVRCWGDGEAAQLGDAARTRSDRPREIVGLDDATQLALGPGHACALRSGGTVVCWGGSDRGPFGYPHECPEDRRGKEVHSSPGHGEIMVYCAAPMPVAGLVGVTALAHGHSHACALLPGGDLKCWGGSGYGELGNREHGAHGSREPIAVVFHETVTAPAGQALAAVAGAQWSCAVRSDRTVACWGSGSLGQLGRAAKNSSATPIVIAGLDDVVALSLGGYHGCARRSDGSVRCWGYNENGELGDGTSDKRADPVTPIGLPPVKQVVVSAASTGAHSCALTEAGEIWCWGKMIASAPHIPPTRQAGVSGASHVAVGGNGTCAVVKGEVRCWGVLAHHGGSGLLSEPTLVAGLDHVVEIGMGANAYCARREDGSVSCWGNRRSEVAGVEPIDLGGPVAAITAGSYGAVAVGVDGTTRHWWIEQTDAATEVPLKSPKQLSCGGDHCCGVDVDGHAVCWGENMNAQLGNPNQGAGGSSETPNVVPL